MKFLKGDVGAFLYDDRDIKFKFIYLRHATKYTNNSLLRDIVNEELRNKDTSWIKAIYKYMECTGITLQFIIDRSRGGLISTINRWDKDRWLSNRSTKSTLAVFI